MSATNSKKRKALIQQQESSLLVFQPSSADSKKPKRVDCELVVISNSKKKSKLEAAQQIKHPGSVEKSAVILRRKWSYATRMHQNR